ncbi:MAG TPA: Asp-tRNA(Asn)/Glu-tRNA(Gln) amidotransferase subunit GatC [Gemmataceae bacterium]|nr:Asp-tRNA(Asn)/Glu-tRNA(Gln) amidotransferase subunit GatC [Gemmataceae bacterium]
MAITLDDARWIAHLSRLELSEAELATMARQLSGILDYIQQLQQVNTDAVEPLAHPLPIQNVFRADEPAPSLTVDEALANAPKRIGPFYGVPAVFD